MAGGFRRTASLRVGRSLRWAGLGTALAVIAFHLEILVARLADATIARPEVAMRWVASAALVAAAFELRRRRSLLGSRAGWMLALAVLLLHLGAPPAPSTPAIAGLLVSLPATIALACSAWGVVPADFTPRRAGRARSRRRDRFAPTYRLGSLGCRFVPRPPPFAVGT